MNMIKFSGLALLLIGALTRPMPVFAVDVNVNELPEITGFVQQQSIGNSNLTALGDIDGDGYDDFGIASRDYGSNGSVILTYGSDDRITSGALSGQVVLEASDSDNVYYAMRALGDTDGDGYDDFAIYNSSADPGGVANAGLINIIYGQEEQFESGDLEDHIVTITGDEESHGFGASLTSADINGDSYSDIIVSAENTDSVRSVFILYGGAVRHSAGAVSGVELTSALSADYTGYALSNAGDLNGDGYDDIVVGSFSNSGATDDEGAIYLLYGQSSAFSSGTLASVSSLLIGPEADRYIGYNLATIGDINNDGYDDLLLPDFYEGVDSVEQYLVYGRSSNIDQTAIDAATVLTTDDRTSYLEDFISFQNRPGDFNGDGYDDFVSSTFDSTTYYGFARVVYGQSAAITDTQFDSEIEMSPTGFTGFRVLGDIDGDGYDDLGISNYFGSDDEYFYSGVVYVVYGQASDFTATTYESSPYLHGSSYNYQLLNADVSGDYNNDGYTDLLLGFDASDVDQGVYIQYGDSEGISSNRIDRDSVFEFGETQAEFGLQASNIGDINGDGYDDIAIGASGEDEEITNSGAVYVIYGQADEIDQTDVDNAVMLYGEDGGGYFGSYIRSAGDMNADGYDDFIVSASNATISGSTSAVYIIYGQASELTQAQITTANSTRILPESGKRDLAAFGAFAAGDVNNDGFSDVIIGQYRDDTVSSPSVGNVYILYGQSDITVDGRITSLDNVVTFQQATGTSFGYSVGTADVNNDGYDDVLIGARYDGSAGTKAGAAYIMYGKSSNLSDSDLDNATVLYGENVNDELGEAVGSIGDMNGDGYEDIMIGARRYDGDETDSGIIYLLYGSEDEMELADAHTIDGEGENDLLSQFGGAGRYDGDTNGDGYSDFLLFSKFADQEGSNSGSAYVLYPNASIALTGAASVTVECADTYTERGANATDPYDKSSISTTTSGSVSTSTIGSYVLQYLATSDLGFSSQTSRTVTVEDTTAPTISLSGSSSVTITAGDSYTDAGATASDICDASVSVSTSGSVDTDTPGTYTLRYTAADDSGNSATAKERTVVVEALEEEEPAEEEPIEEVGDTKSELGAVVAYTRKSNGQVTVEYAGGDSKTYTLFTISGKPKVQLHTNDDILIAINKQYMRTYDAYSGEKIDQVKLFKNKQYNTKFKRLNIYKKVAGQNNVMVLAQTKKKHKKQFKLRSFVVKDGGKITRRAFRTITLNKKTNFSKLTISKNNKSGKNARVLIKRNGKTLKNWKYRVTKPKGILKKAV